MDDTMKPAELRTVANVISIRPSSQADGELIPIFEQPIGEETHSVNGRDLHAALEVGADYPTWMKRRISGLGLEKGRDYEVFLSSEENSVGRPRTEYSLTIDAAKHIALAERNDRGRLVREYFIAAEKKLRGGGMLGAPTPELLWAEAELERERRLTRLLALEERKLAAASIVDLLDRYPDIDPQVARVVHVKAAELTSGQSLGLLLPASSQADWMSPAEIAERYSVANANRVGRIISKLGLRGDAEHCMAVLNKANASDRTVTSYRYSPTAVERIVETLRARGWA